MDYKAIFDSDVLEMSFRIDNDTVTLLRFGDVLCELPIIRYFFSDDDEALFIDTECPVYEVIL